jgi:hypothetical protein
MQHGIKLPLTVIFAWNFAVERTDTPPNVNAFAQSGSMKVWMKRINMPYQSERTVFTDLGIARIRHST